MKESNKAIFILSVTLLFFSFLLESCGKMDDTYREFLSDGETVYVAKADSLKVRSGRERVQLQWLVLSDPKVKRYKVFWNNRRDSIEHELNRSENNDTIRLIVDNLQGGVYEFEVFQFGNHGERSVSSSVTGRAYDDSYEAYLPNRTVESAETDADGKTTIHWNKYNNSDMIGIDFSYTSSSDEQVGIVIPPDELETVLTDVKSGSEIQYRTMFKPDSLAIDTFYSAYNSVIPKEDITAAYLKNYKLPFERLEDWDGSRWGVVADWTVNDGAKISSCTNGNCYGSWDGHNSFRQNSMSVQTSAAEPQALNGKIYQPVILPKGDYELELFGVPEAGIGGTDERYLMVALGRDLPDVDNLNTALSYTSFIDNKAVSTSFTLEEPTEVSLGILFHFVNTSQAFNIESFKLIRK